MVPLESLSDNHTPGTAPARGQSAAQTPAGSRRRSVAQATALAGEIE
jgi:hypothetical protein